MALGDSDLDLFLSDFGVDVYFNGSPTSKRANKEEYDERVVESQMQTASIGRVKAITCKTSDLEGVSIGSSVLIGSVTYYVREPILIQEGAFTHLLLSHENQS